MLCLPNTSVGRRWHRSDGRGEKKKRGRHRLNGRKAEPDKQTTEQTGSHTELQCSLRWIDHSGGKGNRTNECVFLRSRSANTPENLNQVFPFAPSPPISMLESVQAEPKKYLNQNPHVDSTLKLGEGGHGAKQKLGLSFRGGG